MTSLRLATRKEFEADCNEALAIQVKVLGSYWMHIDPRDESLTPNLLRDGYWEGWISRAVARYIKPGSWCVDVGAHFGYYSLLMARCGAGNVLAVEPQAALARLLRDTITTNKLGNTVRPVEVALGAEKGVRMMNFYGRLTGSASFVEAPGWTISHTSPTNVTSLDDLIANYWPQCDFVKIDCEGSELSVWYGMKESLRQYKPTVAMEIDVGRGYDPAELVARIREKNYHVGVIDDEGDIVEWDGDLSRGWRMLWLTR